MEAGVAWSEISAALDELLECDEAERAQRLEELQNKNPALHREVQALLEAEEEPLEFLDDGARGLMEASGDGTGRRLLEEGAEVGPYRVVREVGRGGMGYVYLAERDDGQFEQEVALKVLRTEGLSQQGVQRFLFERQILASLNHPSIARVFDGGVLEDGRPYLVMEYVEGEPITAYCNNKKLSIRDRLQLFASVCDAVQHAHRNLVVHRDLKPSNIYVTREGHVKLLDFGIAKLLQSEPDEAERHTRTGAHLLTPEYAAPEQVQGGAVTTATDVYALGILLYELLTGCRPYDSDQQSPYEVMRLICDREPTRPSTILSLVQRGDRTLEEGASAVQVAEARRTQVGDLQKRLRGDLDAIILYALRKEPAHRYASAQALAEDVRRHLNGTPIHARADSVWYRTRKFLQRHRWEAAATALVAVLVVGYAFTVTWQARTIAEERDRVELEAQRSEQVAGFLRDLFTSTDPFGQPSTEAGAGDLTARQLVDRGAQRLQQLEDQPLLQADLQEIIAAVYVNMGYYEDAAPLLNQAEQRYRQEESLSDAALRVRATRAAMLTRQGYYEESEDLLMETIAALEANPPDNDSAATEQLRGFRSALGLLQSESGNTMAAVQTYRALLEEPGIRSSPYYASIVHDKAMALGALGAFEDALPLHRESLAFLQAREQSADVQITIASVKMSKAFTLQRMGELDRAEELHLEALAMRRQLLGSSHPHVASSLIRLGILRAEQGRGEEAYEMGREGYAILSEYLPEDHWQLYAASGVKGLGLALQGRFAEGIPKLKEAHEVFKYTLGPDDWRTRDAAQALQQAQQARQLMGG